MAFGKKKEPEYIDSRAVKHSKSKLWLWLLWLIVMIVSIGYCVMSFISFRKIVDVAQFEDNGLEGDVLWAVLAATFIGPFTVAAFFAFGTIILVKKTVSESGMTYSYGALHWSALWMAVVVLQSGVALHGQKAVMRDLWARKPPSIPDDLPWASGDTSLIIATYVFAYVLAFFYVILFIVMFFLRKALTKLMLPDGQPARMSYSHSHRKSSDSGAVKHGGHAHTSGTGEGSAVHVNEAAAPPPAKTEPLETTKDEAPPATATEGGAWDKPPEDLEAGGKGKRHHRFHRKADKPPAPAEV